MMDDPTAQAEGGQNAAAAAMEKESAPATGTASELAAAALVPAPTPTGRALKRMLDDDIEAEMEAALAGFSADSVLVAPEPATHPAPASGDSAAAPPRGNQVERRTVRVLAVRGDDIFVDLGEKSEGIVSALQFDKAVPRAGDLVELVLDHFDRDNNLFILRRPGTAQEADWGTVAKGMIVDAIVRKVNKGGLEVTVNGIRGFLPAGQVDLVHIPDLGTLVGQTLRCEITEVSLSSRNLVVSRKAILERERAERARATLESLAEGQIKDGVVKKIMDFGAFVDIGGVDGLIHVSQISWQKVHHPGDVLRPGQEVQVVVLNFDKETKKIGLGLRQLSESPWSKAADKYRPGAVVSGRVSKLMDFGAFVELEPGIEGLVHISELAGHRVRRVGEVVKLDQVVEVKVLDFDEEKNRISLSLKAAQADALPDDEEASAATAPVDSATPATPSTPKRPPGTLKGGLGGSSGPLFG